MTITKRRVCIQHATHINLRHPFRAHVTYCQSPGTARRPAVWNHGNFGKGDRRIRVHVSTIAFWMFDREATLRILTHAYGRQGTARAAHHIRRQYFPRP